MGLTLEIHHQILNLILSFLNPANTDYMVANSHIPLCTNLETKAPVNWT